MFVRLLCSILTLSVFAQQHIIVGPGVLSGCDFQTGQLTAECIPQFLGHLIQVIIGFIGAMLAINIILAGYQIAIANVIDDKTAGKNRLIWSLVGFAVAVSCYLVVDVIIDMFLTGSTALPN